MTSTKQQIDHQDIDSIEFELIKQDKLKPGKDNNYINNRELYEEFVRYNETKKKALAEGKPVPPLTNKIGEAIIQIATRRCNSRMYVGYTNNWKEEMIGNAILTATCNGHNFDPDKYNNPFAYLTQICDNAIREQLNFEKREVYVRNKSFVDSHGFVADLTDANVEESDFEQVNETNDIFAERVEQVHQYEQRMQERREKHAERRRKQIQNVTLEFDDDENDNSESE